MLATRHRILSYSDNYAYNWSWLVNPPGLEDLKNELYEQELCNWLSYILFIVLRQFIYYIVISLLFCSFSVNIANYILKIVIKNEAHLFEKAATKSSQSTCSTRRQTCLHRAPRICSYVLQFTIRVVPPNWPMTPHHSSAQAISS